MWLQEESCVGVIQKIWLDDMNSSQPTSLMAKLEKVGEGLKEWERSHFGCINKNIEDKRKELGEIQMSPPSEENISRIQCVENELRSLLNKEEAMWHQRSRTNWLKSGDKNTSFFHQIASGRKKRNAIDKIRDANGLFAEEEDRIEQIFCEYFEDLFKSEDTFDIDATISALDSRVTSDMNKNLDAKFTKEEVVAALNQMHPLKGPGLDGIPALFHVKFWSIVEHDVVSVVLDILNHGMSPKPINQTCIALIPKKKSPDHPKDIN